MVLILIRSAKSLVSAVVRVESNAAALRWREIGTDVERRLIDFVHYLELCSFLFGFREETRILINAEIIIGHVRK